MAQVSSISTLISWAFAVATITSVSLLDLAGTHVTVWQVSAVSVVVAVVGTQLTLVDWDLALVTVSNVAALALAVIAGRFVDTVSVLVASVLAELALVDLWVAADTVAVEAILANALIARSLLSVDSSLWNALGVLVTVVVTVGAIIGLIARVLSELLEVEAEFVLPSLVAFLLDFTDNGFEGVGPVASGLVVRVVDETTSDVTGIISTGDSSVAHGFLSQSGQFSGDGFPGRDSFLNTISGLESNLLEFSVGECAVLVQVAHASIQVVRMDAVGSVAVNIRVSLVTGTLEAGKGIFTGGVFVTVVLAGDALVDLWLATVLSVLVVAVLANAATVFADLVLAALDAVAFVLVLAVENASASVAGDWAVVVVLADALVALALFDTSSVLTTWVGVALLLVAALLAATVVTVIALALETVALVDTCGILRAVVCTLGALVLVAVWLAVSVFHRVALFAFALVAIAFVVAGSVVTATSVVCGTLVLVAAVISVTAVAGVTLARVALALVNTSGIVTTGVAVALVLVAFWNALVVLKLESVLAGASVALALVNAVGVSSATTVVDLALIGIAALVSVTVVTLGALAGVGLASVDTD